MKTKLILGSLLSLTMAFHLNAKDVPRHQAPCSTSGEELIANGDFNLGNSNFTSGYSYLSGSTLGLYGNGSTVDTYNINQITSAYSITDHTGGNGYVMHFPDLQGANVGKVFWQQNPITVSPGKIYKLSIWVREPSGNCSFQAVGTIFDIYINGTAVQSSDNVGDCLGWHNKVYTWYSGPNTTANIQIKNGTGNGNSNLSGMDLLLDDISFKECIPPPPCENLGDERIFNGDFTLGNTGFTSGYSYLGGCAPGGIQGNGTQGSYNINPIYGCYSVYDHLIANGNVLHFPDIDGTKTTWDFWKQAVTVTTGKTYVLSFWVYEPNGNCGSFQPLGTNFDVYVDALQLSASVVGGCANWYKKTYTWIAGSSSATIRIVTGSFGNYNQGTTGMDLIIDDISLRECGSEIGRSVGTVGIETLQNIADPELMIMPNPSNGNTTLRSSIDVELKITNEIGQTIRVVSLNAENNHTVSLNNLSEGIYFINSYSANTMLIKRKLIITK